MKKVINGAVYNTDTAKKICEQFTEDPDHTKGAIVKKVKQLYKTKSGKYFFYIKDNYIGYVDANNDDIDPKFEEAELEEKKILLATYEAAFQFASEFYSDTNSNEIIDKYFPDLTTDSKDEKKSEKNA
ncbi:hypothetical protein SFC66_12430 [Terribacillus saccharophilus]|uniref:hypothetical protein n=1 Tax=Terribacillus saccharophilus TaxID=361277 RepID=UPI0039828BB0